MPNSPTYIPTFRSRQQENLVLSNFDFGDYMYPLVEVIKPYDRKRPQGSQRSFTQIYLGLISSIQARRVFVDLPLFLTSKASMKDDVLAFYRGIILNRERRTDHIMQLAQSATKIIPVISSFLTKTGEAGTLNLQAQTLRPVFGPLAFRTHYATLVDEWPEILDTSEAGDFLIIDFDTLHPYPSPAVRKLKSIWENFEKGNIVILRSAINTDITNVGLDHDDIVFDVDNGLLDMYRSQLSAQCFADYAGIKKDDLTTGGTISPGFLWYDPTENQFTGFKGNLKELSEFEETIIPDLIKSQPTKNMQNSGRPYLESNPGWEIIQSIRSGAESGKSQAKFKKIAMLHYLHCIKVKIDAGDFNQTE